MLFKFVIKIDCCQVQWIGWLYIRNAFICGNYSSNGWDFRCSQFPLSICIFSLLRITLLFFQFVNSFVENTRVIGEVLFLRSVPLLILRSYADKLILTGSFLNSVPFFLPSNTYDNFFPLLKMPMLIVFTVIYYNFFSSVSENLLRRLVRHQWESVNIYMWGDQWSI